MSFEAAAQPTATVGGFDTATASTPHWQLSCIQLTSGPDPQQNLAEIRRWCAALPAARPQLVALPEGALCFGGAADANVLLQEPLGQGPIQAELAAIAREFAVYLLVGTFPTAAARPEQFAASSLLFSPAGDLLADYQKIHLFDAQVADGTGAYRESSNTQAGQKVTVADLGELKLGLSVCYDVRFAGLFMQMAARGMNVLAVPAAFTTVTGEAHWQVLLRARAIETQSFVVAPAQTGRHANGRETFGHSLIIDPWGRVLADAGTAPGVISCAVNLQESTALAAKMPIASHQKFGSEWL